MNSSPNENTPLTCISNTNKPVSYWYIHKLPQSNTYIYYDSVYNKVQYISSSIWETGLLQSQIESIKTEWENNGYVLYNDQAFTPESGIDPETQITSNNGLEYKALGKGIIVFKTNGNATAKGTGYHIKHTVPGFPVPTSDGKFRKPSTHPSSWLPMDFFGIDSIEYSYGHTFWCHSFNNISSFAEAIQGTNLYIYRTNSFPIPDPYFNSIGSLFQKSSTPAKQTTVDGIMLIKDPNYLGASNLYWTGPNTLKNKTYRVVTEKHLTFQFSSKYAIPTKIQRWRSTLDKSNIGTKDIKSPIVCFTEIYNQQTGYLPDELVICVNNPALNDFLRFTFYKVLQANGQETVPKEHLVREIHLKMPPNPYLSSSMTPQKSLLSRYYEALGNNLLKNSQIEFKEFSLNVYNTDEIWHVNTDKNANFKIAKAYDGTTVQFNTYDTALNFILYRRTPVKPTGSLLDYEPMIVLLANPSGASYPNPLTDKRNDILFLYKIAQESFYNLKSILPANTFKNIRLYSNVTTNQAYFDNHYQFSINMSDFSVETALRAIAHYTIVTLNPSYLTPNIDLSPHGFDIESTDTFTPFFKGLINSISMYLRSVVFPQLPHQSHYNTLNSWVDPRDIEYFSSSSKLNNIKNEGWITSYLWDLIDDSKDSREDTLFFNDFDSIPVTTLFTAIKNNPKANDIVQFSNFTESLVPTSKLSFIQQLKTFNNIFECPPRPSPCTPTSMNPFDLKSMFTSRRICMDDLNLISDQDLKYYTSLWAADYSQLLTIDWSTNRLFDVVYDDPNFKQQKLLPLIPFLPQEEEDVCKGGWESMEIVSPDMMIKITKNLQKVTKESTFSFVFNGLSIFYLPPESTSGLGLGVVKYQGRLCNFEFLTESDFITGRLFNSCPVNPIITNVVGLNGPPSVNTLITISGRRLDGLSISVGSKNCPISHSIPSVSALDQDVVICSGPTGLGNSKEIKFTPTSRSKLPDYYQTKKYYFRYDPPVISSIIYPSSVVDGKLEPKGSIITIVGKNFFENTQMTDQSLKLWVGNMQQTLQGKYQSGGNDHLIFKAVGVGLLNLVEVSVENQSARSNILSENLQLNYLAPKVTSLSTSTSPVNGGGRLTISGNNFAPTADFLKTMSIFIGAARCTNEQWINENSVAVDIPKNFGNGRPVFVEVGSQLSDESSAPKFSYDKPQLYELVYNNIKTNGTNSGFWVTGINLGAKGDTIAPFVKVFYEDSEYIEVDCITDGSVYMNKPDTTTPPQEGEEEEYDVYKELDSAYKTTVDFDCFYCFMTPGIGADFNFTVHVYNQAVNSSAIKYGTKKSISFNKPNITSIEPKDPITTDGEVSVRINGTDFVPNELVPMINDRLKAGDEQYTTLDTGLEYNNITLHFNDEIKFQCNKDLDWVSSETLNFTAPPGFGKDLNVTMYVGGQLMSRHESWKFSYERPNITLPNEKKSFPLGREYNLTIEGENFIPEALAKEVNENATRYKEYNNVYIKDNECKKLEWVNSKKVICTIPIDSGKDIPVQVKVGDQKSDKKSYYSYDRPKITRLSPPIARENTVVDLLIVGENFGNKGKNPDPTFYFNGSPYPCEPYTQVPDSNKNDVVCKVGPLPEGFYPVSVKLNGQESDNVYFEVYGRPIIVTIVPLRGKVEGREPITISGKNLIELESGIPIVTWNDVPVPEIISISRSMIIFKNPPGGGKAFIKVNDNNRIAIYDKPFQYNNPILTSITPLASKTQESVQLKIFGSDLGLPDLSKRLKVSVGGKPCGNPIAESSSLVKCMTPLGDKPGPVSVFVEFEGESSITSQVFTYTEQSTPTPETSTGSGGGGGGSLIPLITTLVTIPIGIAFGAAMMIPGGGGAATFASILTITCETVLANEGKKLSFRLIGRAVGQQLLLTPSYTNHLLFDPNINQFVDNVLSSETPQQESSFSEEDTINHSLHTRKLQSVDTMSFDEPRQAFSSLTDRQLLTQSNSNGLSGIEIIKQELTYVIERSTYYEVSTTVTFTTSATVDGVTYNDIILNGAFYGSVDK
eukprot:gene4841-6031_t